LIGCARRTRVCRGYPLPGGLGLFDGVKRAGLTLLDDFYDLVQILSLDDGKQNSTSPFLPCALIRVTPKPARKALSTMPVSSFGRNIRTIRIPMASFFLDVNADKIAHRKAKSIRGEAQDVVNILHDLADRQNQIDTSKNPKAAPRTSGPWKRNDPERTDRHVANPRRKMRSGSMTQVNKELFISWLKKSIISSNTAVDDKNKK
jgi:hypothetical protein